MNDLTKELRTANQELKQQTRIAELQRDFDKQQAKQLVGGGVKALMDPASFEQMSSKMADAMEDIFVGRGGVRGALGVNNVQAGGGFLRLVSLLREQGVKTEDIVANNPVLRGAAIKGRASQIKSQGEDLAFFGTTMGDSATRQLGLSLIQNADKIATDQVDAQIKGDEKLEKILDEIKVLMAAQGQQSGTSIKAIEGLLSVQTVSQVATFTQLDTAATKLEAASLNLNNYVKLRQFDDTDDRALRDSAKQQIKDENEIINQALPGLMKQFAMPLFRSGDYFVNPFGQSSMGFLEDFLGQDRLSAISRQEGTSMPTVNSQVKEFIKVLLGEEGRKAITDTRREHGLKNMNLFGDLNQDERLFFASDLLERFKKANLINPNEAAMDRLVNMFAGTDSGSAFSGNNTKGRPFSLAKIFGGLASSEIPNAGIITKSLDGLSEAFLRLDAAQSNIDKKARDSASFTRGAIAEQERRGLNPTAGILNEQAMAAAQALLGRTSVNADQNMFEVSKNIFGAAEALNVKETPFITAAKEIAQASQAGFHVTIDDAKISMDASTVDIIANKTAEKITGALAEMSNVQALTQKVVSYVVNKMPPNQRSAANAMLLDKTGSVAKHFSTLNKPSN